MSALGKHSLTLQQDKSLGMPSIRRQESGCDTPTCSYRADMQLTVCTCAAHPGAQHPSRSLPHHLSYLTYLPCKVALSPQ